MTIELINHETAFQKFLDLKDMAYSIAMANDTVPAFCNAPECQLFTQYAEIAQALGLGYIAFLSMGCRHRN